MTEAPLDIDDLYDNDPNSPAQKRDRTKRMRAWHSVFFGYMRNPPANLPVPIRLKDFPPMQRLPEKVLRMIAMGLSQNRSVDDIGESLGIENEPVRFYLNPAHWSDGFKELVESFMRIRSGADLQHAVFMSEMMGEAEEAIRYAVEQRQDPSLALKVAKDILSEHSINFQNDQKQIPDQTNTQFNFYSQPRVQDAMMEAVTLVRDQAKSMKALMPEPLQIPTSPFISVSAADDTQPVVDILQDVPRTSPDTEASEGLQLETIPED